MFLQVRITQSSGSLIKLFVADQLTGDNYNPLSNEADVDEAIIEAWRKKRREKRCGGMGDLCTGPCQAFS